MNRIVPVVFSSMAKRKGWSAMNATGFGGTSPVLPSIPATDPAAATVPVSLTLIFATYFT